MYLNPCILLALQIALLKSPSMVVRDGNGVRRYIGWAAVL